MLTTEGLPGEKGERMRIAEACTQFDKQPELVPAVLVFDAASCACDDVLIRTAVRKSHRYPLQQSLVETANQDSNRHHRYQWY